MPCGLDETIGSSNVLNNNGVPGNHIYSFSLPGTRHYSTEKAGYRTRQCIASSRSYSESEAQRPTAS